MDSKSEELKDCFAVAQAGGSVHIIKYWKTFAEAEQHLETLKSSAVNCVIIPISKAYVFR